MEQGAGQRGGPASKQTMNVHASTNTDVSLESSVILFPKTMMLLKAGSPCFSSSSKR